MKVYFDASVLIAAILSPNGVSAQLLKFIRKGPIVGIASQTVIEEVLEEDHLQKIKRSKWEVEKFIAQSGLIVRKKITGDETAVYENLVAENDSHIIAGANITKCQYLVTLDKKHLPRPDIKERFLPLCIVSPKELLRDVVKK